MRSVTLEIGHLRNAMDAYGCGRIACGLESFKNRPRSGSKRCTGRRYPTNLFGGMTAQRRVARGQICCI